LGYIDVTGIPEHYVITVEGLLVVGIHGTRPDVKGATVATSNPIGQVRVFIGHGRDPQWRELAEFLRRSGKCDVFYYESDASVGSTTIETLNSLLNKAEIAFLVHTAEDEAKDQFRARENVVHEAGLFQGKLGFSRALILLEEGCNEYSNIRGLNQIRFKKGQIGTTFGEVLVKINNEFAR